LTFFLPCGFTQSLQLVALASGSFMSGAFTMFTFALGTLPSLLGISAISSHAKGTSSRLFLRFAGTLVVLLALFNLQNGLALAGVELPFPTPEILRRSPATRQAALPPAGKVQTVRMAVGSYGYEPSELTIRAGTPVRWIVDGTNASGCTRGIVIPSLGIRRILNAGENVIEFTAQNPGRLPFSCSMGMVRGAFNVI
jgi:plastocyanin